MAIVCYMCLYVPIYAYISHIYLYIPIWWAPFFLPMCWASIEAWIRCVGEVLENEAGEFQLLGGCGDEVVLDPKDPRWLGLDENTCEFGVVLKKTRPAL